MRLIVDDTIASPWSLKKPLLDYDGVAVRTGHHCAWPLHRALNRHASTRASFYIYNTHAEIDALADAVRYAKRFFGA